MAWTWKNQKLIETNACICSFLCNYSVRFFLSQTSFLLSSDSPHPPSPPNLISPSGSYLLRGKSAHVPLCVLGGWCHHPPNQHGYNQLPLSTCSMQLLPQEARSPHSFKAPTPLLGVSNVAGKFLMAKTNIIYVGGKRNETKRGGLHTLICFLT